MSERQGKRYTSRFKFQVMLEVLRGSKTIGQIARSYGVHPITVIHWKREFMEKGPEIFSQQTTIHEYEKKVEELERLIGHKEVEIALLKNFWPGAHSRGENRVSQGIQNRIWAEQGFSGFRHFERDLALCTE